MRPLYELGRTDGDTTQAIGYLGEAALRMLGVSVQVVQELRTARAAAKAAECFVAPGALGNVSRPLTAADLGIRGTLTKLKGAFTVSSGRAVVKIDMIEGQIHNPFEIIRNLMNTAKANGATTLRIEATLANEQLFNILRARYGLQTAGGIDLIEIILH